MNYFLLSIPHKPVVVEKLHTAYNTYRTSDFALAEGPSPQVLVTQDQSVIKFEIKNPFSLTEKYTIMLNLNSRTVDEKNEIWTYPLFQLRTDRAQYYSSSAEILLKILKHDYSIDLNFAAIDYFLENGFLPLGETFISGIKKINAHYFERQSQGVEPLDHKKMWTLFLKEVENCFLLNKNVIFNLSGGLDTRLISFALQELGRVPDQVISVQSPFVSMGEDADVEIPKLICKNMGWNHIVKTPDPQAYSYLAIPEEDELVLSGLFGGEVYGGQAGAFLNSLNSFSHFEAIRAYANSYRSTIYNSVVGSWSSPLNFQKFAFSPFMTRDLVRYLVSVDFLELKNYLGYKQHYDTLKTNHFDLPLCSALSVYHSEFQLPPTVLFKDPKPYEQAKKLSSQAPQDYQFKLVDYASEKWAQNNSKWHKNSHVALKNLKAYCIQMKERYDVHL